MALAWAAFEVLLALAGGASRLPDWRAAVLYVAIPIAVYGSFGFLLGGFALRPRLLRLGVPVLLGLFGVAQFLRMGVLSKGFEAFDHLWLAPLAFLAFAGLVYGRLPRNLYRGLWWLSLPIAIGVSWLWASEQSKVRFAAEPSTPAEGPNVVLISWDTVRADVLPVYGGTGLSLPNLQALAERSVVFDQAIAVAPITGPSHATMLTGLYPISHGLRSNGTTRLSLQVPTLGERLAAQGYRTGAFVAAYPLLARFGLFRGFQVYDDRLPNRFSSQLQDFGPKSFLWLMAIWQLLGGRNEASAPGDQINARALEWYRGQAGAAFLFLHYYDAHGPFAPAEPYRAQALAAEAEALPRAIDPDSGQEMLTMQRGEIAWLDHLLGEVIAALEAKDPGLENTIVVLTSDHGECFGEGGIIGEHMPSLYDATQHVPLIVHLPGGRRGGTRVGAQVSHLDLAPTLLSELGLLIPGTAQDPLPEDVPGMQGLDLQAVISGEAELDRDSLYLEAFQERLRDERKQGLRTTQWKFLRWVDDKRELFRIDWDRPGAGELENRMANEAERARQLETKMNDLIRSLPEAKDSVYVGSLADQRALAELGYTDDEAAEEQETEE